MRLRKKTIEDIVYAFMAYVEMCWDGASKEEKRLYWLAKKATDKEKENDRTGNCRREKQNR